MNPLKKESRLIRGLKGINMWMVLRGTELDGITEEMSIYKEV